MRIFFVIVSALVVTGCTVNRPNTVITSFEGCTAAGNAIMESYPRQCRTADGTLFVEVIANQPQPPSEDDTLCTAQYEPVCGEVQVQCIKAPCPPIKQTFSNRCFATKAGAFNIASGECL